jgi:hypothetical protein
MQSIISKEFQLVMSSGFDIFSYSDSMFPGSRESVAPRIRRDISRQKNSASHFLSIKTTSSVETPTKGYQLQSGLFH